MQYYVKLADFLQSESYLNTSKTKKGGNEKMKEIKEEKYKSSYIAIMVKGLGTAYMLIAIMCPIVFVAELFKSGLTDDTWGLLITAPFMFIIGIILMKCGQMLNDRKVYKSWLKILRGNDYVEKIKNDVNFAKTIHDSCPNKKCQKFVISLNSDVVNM